MAHAAPMQQTTDDLLRRADNAIAAAKVLCQERRRILDAARMWSSDAQMALRLQSEPYADAGLMIRPNIRR